MSDYLVLKEYNGIDLLGKKVNIPMNSEIKYNNGIIEYNKRPICYEGSAIAINYFIYNGDGNGIDRKRYFEGIYLNPREVSWNSVEFIYDENNNIVGTKSIKETGKYSPTEIDYIQRVWSKYIIPGTSLLFNDYFYKAPIKDIYEIFTYLEEQKNRNK